MHPTLSREFDAANIPSSLKEVPRWAPWKGVLNAKRGGKYDKIPMSAVHTTRRISTASPGLWFAFDQANAAFDANPDAVHGLGFCITDMKGMVWLDLDSCVTDGVIADWALAIVTSASSYTETSPSGKGLRIVLAGEIDFDWTNHDVGIEVYQGDHPRFLTVTGQHLPGTPRTVSAAPAGFLVGLSDQYRGKNEKPDAPPAQPIPGMADLDGRALLASVLDQLPQSVQQTLAGPIEGDGDGDGDGSRALTAARNALAAAGLGAPERLAVLMASDAVMDLALNHRRQDHDRAVTYLWEHHALPAKAAVATDADFEVIPPSLPGPAPEDGGLTDLEQMALGKSATQDSAALALRKLHAGRYVYAHQFGHWMVYDGTRWLADPQLTLMEEARKVCRRANKAADLKELTKASFFRGVVDIAKHDPAFSVLGTEFDANTNWLNTPAGVVDLTTGKMRPHDPRDRLSKITAVAPSADGGKLFIETLFDICDGDFELMDFLQVSLGAMLSGAPEGHWLQFWYGTGRNGKNLLADLVFHVLGDYAHKMPSSALMTRSQEQHPTSLAALAGRRFVLSSEVPDGAFWNTSTIKELTGDETITARFMRQDEFTFRRTHKHLILGNHRPQFRETDPAMVSRMKLVPFSVSFAGRENPDLPRLLRANAGFVLSWLVEGHLMWRANGKRLPPCEAVEAASRDYFAAQSTTAMWLSECCARVADDGRAGRGWHKSSTLYASYSEWKKSRGEAPVSQTRWGDEMEKLGLRRVKADGFRYVGVRLSHPPDFAKEVIDNE